MKLPKKPVLRRLLVVLPFALIFGAIVAPSFLSLRLDEAPWPRAALPVSVEIPLNRAMDLIEDPAQARRAAVLGNFLFIEVAGPDLLDAYRPEGAAAPARAGSATPTAASPNVARARLTYPADDLIADLARGSAVDLEIFSNPGIEIGIADRLLQILPLLVLVGLGALLFARGGAGPFGLTSGYSVVERDKLTEGFADVAGIDTAREEIQEIVDFLKNPAGSGRLGGRMPKGVLFAGPAGTGKTLLARAAALEAGVPFFNIEAAGINQLFVGAGAMKLRRAFRHARRRAPCIVFFDEVDSLGRRRGFSGSGAGDEKATTLNALLTELDGFDPREGIVVIAATNRLDTLDPAMIRRGRFDRVITFSAPDIAGRLEILRVKGRKIKTAPGLDYQDIARTTFGFTGADLDALVNEAALDATRNGKSHVDLASFRTARGRLLLGTSGSRRVLGPKERRITAIHEAGHAVVALTEPHADPVEHASILSQGDSAGHVLQSPEEDLVFQTYGQLIARIRVAVAGRVAEEMVFGRDGITSGAASDIAAATRCARHMVTRFGMSEQGFVLIDPDDPHLVDPDNPPLRTIRALITAEMDAVFARLHAMKPSLLAIADALEAHETLTAAEMREILDCVRVPGAA